MEKQFYAVYLNSCYQDFAMTDEEMAKLINILANKHLNLSHFLSH
jgi:hypothetical protein